MDESPIRSLARGLAVLRTMNSAQRWSLHTLHRELKLPKPTLFRILQALQAEGYVRADVTRGHYMLTAKVCELSAGYTEQSRVIAAGGFAAASSVLQTSPMGRGFQFPPGEAGPSTWARHRPLSDTRLQRGDRRRL